jgi:pilus assembly protein CpaB
MNRNRLVAIGLLAVCLALIASFALYRAFLRYAVSPNSAMTTTTIVAAANDLPVGTKLEEKDLRLVKAPATDLPPGVFHSTSEVVGRGVILPITKNETILASQLASENGGAGLPSLIPDGMRAVSVKVNDVISVAGFVTAGTRVDVLMTGQPTKDNDPTMATTTTVLENVQVLAANQKLQKNAEGEPQQATVITLMVNPEDAQKLTLAASEGKIQLALRNPLDTKNEAVPPVRDASLFHVQPLEAPKSQTKRVFVKTAPAPVPAPSIYVVEMIRGDKRDTTKF